MKKKPYGVFLVHEIRYCKFWSVLTGTFLWVQTSYIYEVWQRHFWFSWEADNHFVNFLIFSWHWFFNFVSVTRRKISVNQIVPLYLPALWLQNPTPLLHSTYFKPCPQWIIWPPTTVFAVVLGRSLFKVFVT